MIDKESRSRRAQQHPHDADFVTPTKAALENITENEPQIALIPDANYVAGVIKLRNFTTPISTSPASLDPRVRRAIARDARERVANTRNWKRAGSACRSRSA